jgi:hypothetical protein
MNDPFQVLRATGGGGVEAGFPGMNKYLGFASCTTGMSCALATAQDASATIPTTEHRPENINVPRNLMGISAGGFETRVDTCTPVPLIAQVPKN